MSGSADALGPPGPVRPPGPGAALAARRWSRSAGLQLDGACWQAGLGMEVKAPVKVTAPVEVMRPAVPAQQALFGIPACWGASAQGGREADDARQERSPPDWASPLRATRKPDEVPGERAQSRDRPPQGAPRRVPSHLGPPGPGQRKATCRPGSPPGHHTPPASSGDGQAPAGRRRQPELGRRLAAQEVARASPWDGCSPESPSLPRSAVLLARRTCRSRRGRCFHQAEQEHSWP